VAAGWPSCPVGAAALQLLIDPSDGYSGNSGCHKKFSIFLQISELGEVLLCRKRKRSVIFQACIWNVKYLYNGGEIKIMQQGWLSNWLVKHDVVHRSLGFDHQAGIVST
jgi:hypothetical protein